MFERTRPVRSAYWTRSSIRSLKGNVSSDLDASSPNTVIPGSYGSPMSCQAEARDSVRSCIQTFIGDGGFGILLLWKDNRSEPVPVQRGSECSHGLSRADQRREHDDGRKIFSWVTMGHSLSLMWIGSSIDLLQVCSILRSGPWLPTHGVSQQRSPRHSLPIPPKDLSFLSYVMELHHGTGS